MQGSRVLITGGAGFIGSHLTEHLIQQGHHVRIVDDLSTGRRENLEHLNPADYRLRHMPISRAMSDPDELLEKVTAVYHLAATVGVKRVVDDPVASISNNVEQTAVLLQQTASRKIPTLIASSSEVYGKGIHIPMHEDDDLRFGHTGVTRWSYGMSKALDEHLALGWAQRGAPMVVVRLFNTIGPRQLGEYGMVVPRFVRSAVRGLPLPVYGDGQQIRCFCDVRDTVDAMVQLIHCPQARGQVVNLGSDQPWSIDQLADRIIELAHSSSRKRYVPLQQAYGERFEDLGQRVPDITRLKSLIGFAPARSIDDTLGELIRDQRLAEGL